MEVIKLSSFELNHKQLTAMANALIAERRKRAFVLPLAWNMEHGYCVEVCFIDDKAKSLTEG